MLIVRTVTRKCAVIIIWWLFHNFENLFLFRVLDLLGFVFSMPSFYYGLYSVLAKYFVALSHWTILVYFLLYIGILWPSLLCAHFMFSLFWQLVFFMFVIKEKSTSQRNKPKSAWWAPSTFNHCAIAQNLIWFRFSQENSETHKNSGNAMKAIILWFNFSDRISCVVHQCCLCVQWKAPSIVWFSVFAFCFEHNNK